jgi:hypothetical protein
MAGTASVVRSWLLLEHAGPWGEDAFVDARLPAGFAAEVGARCEAALVRPLLIRRTSTPGGARNGVRCFAIRSGPEPPWIETTSLDRLTDALGLDIEALGRGSSVGLAAHEDPVLLVCTHGRHDRCCAERGRPLASALAATHSDQTWESSHFGGDRFAGNLIAFPHGLYFGRVAPPDAEHVVTEYTDRRLDLDHLRGRSCYPMAVQAAELQLRTSEHLAGLDDVVFVRASRFASTLEASFQTPRGRFEVVLDIDQTDPHFLTCRSETEHPAPRYRAASIRRID